MCKYSTAHKILKQLQIDGYLQGTKITEYEKLIHAWKTWQIKPIRDQYFLKNPFRILEKTKLNYAMTTYIAENLIQKYLFPSKIQFYINPADRIEWRNLILADDGFVGRGNVTLLFGDEHAFYHSFLIDSMKLVSIPQLILDLLNEGASCTEAANMLMLRVRDSAIPKL